MGTVKSVRVRLNIAGLKQILNSEEVTADLRARAERVRAALPTDRGEEWEVVELRGDRVSFIVKAANVEARKRAAEDPVLQQALGAGRG
jgi:hypothetical protein